MILRSFVLYSVVFRNFSFARSNFLFFFFCYCVFSLSLLPSGSSRPFDGLYVFSDGYYFFFSLIFQSHSERILTKQFTDFYWSSITICDVNYLSIVSMAPMKNKNMSTYETDRNIEITLSEPIIMCIQFIRIFMGDAVNMYRQNWTKENKMK